MSIVLSLFSILHQPLFLLNICCGVFLGYSWKSVIDWLLLLFSLIWSLFEQFPFLNKSGENIDEVFENWKKYKYSVPVYGAIMLNQNLDKVECDLLFFYQNCFSTYLDIQQPMLWSIRP